uniref:Cytochrome b5 heme-binding domain-containing protein n=1 Tax=Aureoumbra lagunensis TaxID=44058 RepID=A0A7S3K3K6_9STRA|mmetsp:Transcript_23763/g.30920  ORF Transcript_23763/g.30920 Transcript_23763/m.30920 type:complete len:187 (-) Transcript_23763:121-681(-)
MNSGVREVPMSDDIMMNTCSRVQEDEEQICDACPYCDDRCSNPCCIVCSTKPITKRQGNRFTRCEIRRHSTAESCWLVAGSTIYDVTSFIPRHPAGTYSIVRNAGGRDCTEDLAFHSGKAQKLWNQHKIGRLMLCPSESRAEPGRLRRWFPVFFPISADSFLGGGSSPPNREYDTASSHDSKLHPP